jgi:hypothetical protein
VGFGRRHGWEPRRDVNVHLVQRAQGYGNSFGARLSLIHGAKSKGWGGRQRSYPGRWRTGTAPKLPGAESRRVSTIFPFPSACATTSTFDICLFVPSRRRSPPALGAARPGSRKGAGWGQGEGRMGVRVLSGASEARSTSSREIRRNFLLGISNSSSSSSSSRRHRHRFHFLSLGAK